MASYTISQGESLSLDYTPSPSQDLANFTCRVQVRNSDGVQGDEKFFTETVNNNRTFTGQLTSAETNNLYVGSYTLGAEVFNTALGFNQEWCCELIITEQCVSPDINGVTALVEFAEVQPTPETQEAAQTAVNSLPISDEKLALDARVKALDPEVEKVRVARLAVEAAETYPWTAVKQSDAQALVDDLVSTIEQGILSARLDALDDRVAAETAVELAEYLTTQDAINAAQPLIDILEPEYQPLLQARLDAVYVPARFEQANPSEFDEVITPWIDPSGFAVRSPNARVSQKLDLSMQSGDGWYSAHLVSSVVPDTTDPAGVFWGVGDLTAIINGTFQDLNFGEQDLAVTGGNQVFYDGVPRSSLTKNVVIAVDYRSASPHVYIIDVVSEAVVFDVVVNITTALDIVTRCSANSALEREWFFEVNTGNDLTNNPFPIDSESILSAFGADTTGYIEGWGGNTNRPLKTQSTVINIDSISPSDPILGDTITLEASVIDGYGVDRSSDVVWYNKFINWYDDEGVQSGDSSTFTPKTYGYYEVVAEYVDTNGIRVRDTAIVDIAGSVPETGVTTIDAPNSHPNVANITDNTARFGTALPFKLAIIANNPMFGRFCYVEFELRTLDIDAQYGFGLTSILNARPFVSEFGDTIMWSGIDDGLNPQDGGGCGTFLQRLTGQSFIGSPWVNGSNAIGNPPQIGDPFNQRLNSAFGTGGVNGSETAYLGLAVDNRDTTKPATVYAFHQDQTTGATKSAGNYLMNNARTPLVATIYCNNESNETVNPDVAINGGSFGAFQMDPRPILLANNVNLTGFTYGWTVAEDQA